MWTKTYKVVGFLEPGIVRFGDKNLTVYISEKAIERYSYRLKGKPVTVGHIEGITEANAQQYSVGDVAVCTEPGECVVTIKNEEADRKIESGERFSCCWVPIKWGPGGTWHNIPYDKELVEMDFTHLAIVPDPRYENVEVFMNSKEYNNRLFDQLPNDPNKVKRNIDKYNLDPGVRHSADRYGDAVRTARQKIKVSNFQNSLNPGQYAFLKKYVKEWNNASYRTCSNADENGMLRAFQSRKSSAEKIGDYTQAKQLGLLKNKPLEGRKVTFSNEADAPDNSSERMDRINKYLQKREDRRMDKQYQTHEAPKQYNPDAKRFYNSNYKYKDGKEFNNECFRKHLKGYMNAKYKVEGGVHASIDNGEVHFNPSGADKVSKMRAFTSWGAQPHKGTEGRQLTK